MVDALLLPSSGAENVTQRFYYVIAILWTTSSLELRYALRRFRTGSFVNLHICRLRVLRKLSSIYAVQLNIATKLENYNCLYSCQIGKFDRCQIDSEVAKNYNSFPMYFDNFRKIFDS